MADLGASLYANASSSIPARIRLSRLVTALDRERLRQLLLDYGFFGLFGGLALACVAVLAIRVGGLEWSLLSVAGVLVGICVAVSLAFALRRRPDALDVAIEADVALGLEQKLSTAWEFFCRDPGADLSRRLAVQAMAARMPNRAFVFPLRVNTWGRLAPVAAALLLLVSHVDLPSIGNASTVTALDPVVAEEGARLRDYGRRMQRRAERAGLPRSAEQAREMQRLGSRMESADLDRKKALSRLRGLSDSLGEQRRSALADGAQANVNAGRLAALASTPGLSDGRLGDLITALRDGTLGAGSADTLRSELADLSRFGVTEDQLDRAIERFSQGDPDALREILERVSEMDEAMREAVEMQEAQKIVEIARHNLGEEPTREGPGNLPGELEEGGGGEDDETLGLRTRNQVDGNADQAQLHAPGGRGVGPNWAEDLRSPVARSDAKVSDALVKPESRFGEGEVMATEARVLPRAGQATVPDAPVDARFEAQMEAVLSRQDFPPHRKSLVRRYFLSIGEVGAGDKESDQQ